MKLMILAIICSGLLFPGFLSAVDIELTAGLNNMTYHPDRVTSHSQSTNFKEFPGYPYGFGNLTLKSDITDNWGYEINAIRDNIQRNSANAKIVLNTDNFNIDFGPFIGIGDKMEIPEFGITGSIELAYPGIFFLAFNGTSTLGTKIEYTGNNSRETMELKLGFWLPYIIPTFSASIKSYTDHHDEFVTINDELLRLQFSIDIFAKNSPVTVRLDSGYQILKRSYIRGYTSSMDELNSFFAGMELKWQITKPFRITAGFEMPVYFMSDEPMLEPENIYKLYKAYFGIGYKIFSD